MMELEDYNNNINNIDNPYIMKCVLVGRYASGKSTLGNMFSNGVFDPHISSTVAMNFSPLIFVQIFFKSRKNYKSIP